MTRPKKRFIAIWSVIGAIVICILIALPLAYVFKPTIPTDEFLPEPDAMTGYYAGREMPFSDEQKGRLYLAFACLMDGVQDWHFEETSVSPVCSSNILPEELCVEFYYDARYEFAGAIGGKQDAIRFTFDTILLSLKPDADDTYCVRAFAATNGSYYKIADRGTLSISLDHQGHGTWRAALRNEIMASFGDPFGIAREPIDTTAIETTAFLDAPDTIIASFQGNAVELTDAQRETVYSTFMQAGQETPTYYRSGSYFSQQDIYSYIAEEACLEFRYRQGRCYVGEMQIGAEGTYHTIETPIAFDAVFLVANENWLKIFYYKDGKYFSATNTNAYFEIGEKYETFYRAVVALKP